MITKSLEDYIEYIYTSISNDKELKAIDIAKKFNISIASVSEALIRLCELGLVIYEGRKGIIVTEKGEIEAKRVIKKHQILLNFFNKTLNIEFEKASDNACKIEHVIDDDIISMLEKFNHYSDKNNLKKDFMEFIQNDK